MIFRQEAIDAQLGRWLGAINVAPPLSRWALTMLAVAVAAAIIGFLIFGHYTHRERVAGRVVPSTGVLNVTAVTAGTVSRVLAHEGQIVQRNEPLLEISSEVDSVALGQTRAQISAGLRDQRHRLQATLAAQEQRISEQTRASSEKLRLLESQIEQIDAQLNLQTRQVASAQSLMDRVQPLRAAGYVSEFQAQQQEAMALGARTELNSLKRQRLDIRQQIAATRQQLELLPLELDTQRNAIAREMADIDQQLANNEAQRALVLRSPGNGVVSALLQKPGQYVGAGQPLLSIVPDDATLIAELLVPSRAVGFIEPGSRVVLRYEAFPYQKFGLQYGEVAAISRSALSPSAVVALTGHPANEPLYRVNVELERQNITAYGAPQALKPGMALSADILMDRRSLLEWVFEPLYELQQPR